VESGLRKPKNGRAKTRENHVKSRHKNALKIPRTACARAQTVQVKLVRAHKFCMGKVVKNSQTKNRLIRFVESF
jgi:hypothetical protein